MFKKRVKKVKQPKNKSIKEKILPKKKKDRLDELRKELGMNKGGPVRQFGGGKKPGRLGKAAQEKPRAEHRRNLRKKP